MGFLEKLGFSGKSPEEPSMGESVFEGGKKLGRDQVPLNVAEGMPLEELRQVIDDMRERLNKGEEVDEEHLNKLEEIYERRSSAYEDREAA